MFIREGFLVQMVGNSFNQYQCMFKPYHTVYVLVMLTHKVCNIRILMFIETMGKKVRENHHNDSQANKARAATKLSSVLCLFGNYFLMLAACMQP